MRDNRKTDIIEALKWAVTAEEPIEFNEKQTKISFNEYKEPDYSEFTPEEITCGKEILKNNLLHGNISFEAQRYNTRSFIWEQFACNLFQLSKPFNYKKYYQKEGIDKIESNDSFFKRREKQQKLPKNQKNILNGNICTYIDWEENLFVTKNLAFKAKEKLQSVIDFMHEMKELIAFALSVTAFILLVRLLPNINSLMAFAILMLFIFSFIVFIYPYQKAFKIFIDIESLKNAIPKEQTIKNQESKNIGIYEKILPFENQSEMMQVILKVQARFGNDKTIYSKKESLEALLKEQAISLGFYSNEKKDAKITDNDLSKMATIMRTLEQKQGKAATKK